MTACPILSADSTVDFEKVEPLKAHGPLNVTPAGFPLMFKVANAANDTGII